MTGDDADGDDNADSNDDADGEVDGDDSGDDDVDGDAPHGQASATGAPPTASDGAAVRDGGVTGIGNSANKSHPRNRYTKEMRKFAVLNPHVKAVIDALEIATSELGLVFCGTVQAPKHMFEQCLKAYRTACGDLLKAFEGVVLLPNLYSRRTQRIR